MQRAPTSTALTSSLNPSIFGESVTFTATVTNGANPVTTGTVTFTDGATSLGAAVALDASGQATLTTSALTAATHTITATFNETAQLATSNDSIDQVVVGRRHHDRAHVVDEPVDLRAGGDVHRHRHGDERAVGRRGADRHRHVHRRRHDPRRHRPRRVRSGDVHHVYLHRRHAHRDRDVRRGDRAGR